MSALKFTNPAHWEAIETHLNGQHGERFAFAHTRILATTAGEPVLEVIGVELISDTDVETDGTGWYLAEEALDRVHNAAAAGGHGLIEFHNHRIGPPRFSRTDEAGLMPMATYVTDLLQGRPYGAGIYADGALHVCWWTRNADGLRRDTFRTVAVIGNQYRILNARPVDDERLTRQAALVGPAGQATIAAMRVAVVGAGGTGSHIALALVYLGFRDVLILDDDHVELSNLNRTVTAGLTDVRAPKNLVARRRMREVDPQITVTPLPALTPDRPNPELNNVDLIVGCVDHDGPRDRLNQIAVDTATPYIDIATGIDNDPTPAAVGGRAAFVVPGGPCLHCLGELDPAEITRWAKKTDQQQLDQQHGYGTGLPNASVVHLNGLVVYAAATELVAWIAGTRPSAQYLDIDLSGHLAPTNSHPGTRIMPRQPIRAKPDCFACAHRRAAAV